MSRPATPPLYPATSSENVSTIFRSGDAEIDGMLDSIFKAIGQRRDSVRVLSQTVEAFEGMPKLFDKEDVEKTRSQLLSANAELEALQTTYAQSQALYQQNVMELETLIREKEEALLSIDNRLGTISNNDVLRLHFGSKQAELKKGVSSVKAQLCSMIQDMFRRVDSGRDATRPDAGFHLQSRQ